MESSYEVQAAGEGINLYGGNLAFFKSRAAECILAGPADTGKTFALCLKVHLCACKYPRAAIALVRKTQTSCYNTVVRTFTERILGPDTTGWPCIPYGGMNRPERFNYHNGSVVFVTGLDKSTRLLSAEFDLIAISQTEELTLPDWETLTTRATGRAGNMPYAQCIGDCNPAYPLHWIKTRSENGGPLTRIDSTHLDNPELYDQVTHEITEAGKQRIGRLDNLTGSRKLRLRGGIWSAAEGVIYDELDYQIHVMKRDRAEFMEFVGAVDEGYTNPATILIFGLDSDRRLHLFTEYYKRGVLQDDFVTDAADLAKEWGATTFYVDPSAAGLKAKMNQAGISTPSVNNEVYDGIQAVKAMLKVAGDGRPRLTFDPDAINTLSEAGAYEWEKGSKDKPKKEHDHAMDPLRYTVMSMGNIIEGSIFAWV